MQAPTPFPSTPALRRLEQDAGDTAYDVACERGIAHDYADADAGAALRRLEAAAVLLADAFRALETCDPDGLMTVDPDHKHDPIDYVVEASFEAVGLNADAWRYAEAVVKARLEAVCAETRAQAGRVAA